VEPLYPRRGLLGGASKDGKMSKLAALAAKRRQRESERSASETKSPASQDGYVASLNKLRISQPSRIRERLAGSRADQSPPRELTAVPESGHDVTVEGGLEVKDAQNSEKTAEAAPSDRSSRADTNLRAQPSAFASIMTSHHFIPSLLASPSILYDEFVAETFDFTEPSPDDIVTKAQNSKGRMTSSAACTRH